MATDFTLLLTIKISSKADLFGPDIGCRILSTALVQFINFSYLLKEIMSSFVSLCFCVFCLLYYLLPYYIFKVIFTYLMYCTCACLLQCPFGGQSTTLQESVLSFTIQLCRIEFMSSGLATSNFT